MTDKKKDKPDNGSSSRLPARRDKAGLPTRRPAPGSLTRRSTFDQYIAEINQVPLLTREEEFELARRMRDDNDKAAAKHLVEANLRFVVKMAYSYRNYNVKLIDLIQEGNIGLMKAVEKFNPDRGYRLISYAVWWIKAYMQNFIIKSWSMVKLGTTQMQRQLFFRYQPDEEEGQRGAVEQTLEEERDDGSRGKAVLVSAEARKRKAQRELMAASRDFSLDATVDGSSTLTFLDTLADETPQQEEQLAKQEIMQLVADKLNVFAKDLSDKEGYILKHRLLSDQPQTLQEIGEEFGVSRERIRQIESSIKDRLQETLKNIEGVDDLIK